MTATEREYRPKEYRKTVLLVDDQQSIADAVKEMLSGEEDIVFHYCSDPNMAVRAATELSPTVILQDLVMPGMSGLTLARLFKAHPAVKEIPLIVLSSREEASTKAEAFAAGANDYLVKLPDPVELIARIRYHSRSYITLLHKNEITDALTKSRQALSAEITRAADYVTSLLPDPILEGPVLADWRFYPSATLGGDSLGYHWIDEDTIAIYLLDVSGHGVGSALMSVSALHMLNYQVLPDADFKDPGSILTALNRTFQMKHHDNLFFTIWYGVYTCSERRLVYAGAGHPPPLVVREGEEPIELSTKNIFIGVEPEASYENSEIVLKKPSVLYVFSDGVFEISKPDGSIWSYGSLKNFLSSAPEEETPEMDRIYRLAQELRNDIYLEDDFSILKVTFT